MCNTCSCENEDRCSVVGSASVGFCCPKCVHFDENHECLRSKVSISRPKSISITRIEVATH